MLLKLIRALLNEDGTIEIGDRILHQIDLTGIKQLRLNNLVDYVELCLIPNGKRALVYARKGAPNYDRWYFVSGGCWFLLESYNASTQSGIRPYITKVACIDANLSIDSLFRDCTSLTEVVCDSVMNTSNWTNMARLFLNCSSLEVLDCSHWNTSKVKYFDQTFQNTNIHYLDFSSWNLAAMLSMNAFLNGCHSLYYIALGPSFFNTNKTIYLNGSVSLGMDTSKQNDNGWLLHVVDVIPDNTGNTTKVLALNLNLTNKSWAAPYITLIVAKNYNVIN